MSKKEKIQVLQLVNGEFYGGAERIQEMILKFIDRDTFQPYCISLMNGTFVKKVQSEEIPIEVVPMRAKIDIRVIFKIAQFAHRNRIALIHTHSIRTNLLGRIVGKIEKVPVVTHVHGSPLHETKNILKRRFNYWIERLINQWSNYHICVSYALKDRLESKKVPKKRIEVIPNGIELNRFRPNHGSHKPNLDKLPARKKLGLDSKTPVISMTALFRPIKGAKYLIKAMPHVIKKYPKTSCLLVGEFKRKSYQKKLMNLSKSLNLEGKIHFLGFRSDISGILAASDMVVLPSLLGEGLPTAILEAMAMGKPVIATSVEGITEIIQEGETGFLVPSGDYQKLAQVIIHILENPEMASRIGSKAQTKVRQQYSAKSMVQKIEQVYFKVLNNSHKWDESSYRS